MKNWLKILGITFISLGIFSACLKPESYPIEPAIEFVSFTPTNDIAELVFSFTDGDGDIGLDINDTLSPYNPGSLYYHNVHLFYYEMMNGNWVRGTTDPNNFPLADTITISYRIKDITPEGKNKALKGSIKLSLI